MRPRGSWRPHWALPAHSSHRLVAPCGTSLPVRTEFWQKALPGFQNNQFWIGISSGKRAEELRLAPCRGFSCHVAKAIAALSGTGCSGSRLGGSQGKEIKSQAAPAGTPGQHSHLHPLPGVPPWHWALGSACLALTFSIWLDLSHCLVLKPRCETFCRKSTTFPTTAAQGHEMGRVWKICHNASKQNWEMLVLASSLSLTLFPGKAEHFLD